jgi:hypothetical protein
VKGDTLLLGIAIICLVVGVGACCGCFGGLFCLLMLSP